MAKEIRISTVALPNGGVNVFLGNGQAVVDARNFGIRVRGRLLSDPANLQVGIQSGFRRSAPSTTTPSPEALGGVLAFRSQSLGRGEFAGPHRRLTGDRHQRPAPGRAGPQRCDGRRVFAFSGPQVNASSINSGNGVITASVSSYSAHHQRLSRRLRRIGYTRSPACRTTTSRPFATLPQTVDGVTLRVLPAATPAAGDSFKIEPTRGTAANINALITDTARIAAAPAGARLVPANLGKRRLERHRGDDTAGRRQPDAGGDGDLHLRHHLQRERNRHRRMTGLTHTPGMTLSYNGWAPSG